MDRAVPKRGARHVVGRDRTERHREHGTGAKGNRDGLDQERRCHQPITRPTPEKRSLYQGPRKSMSSTPSDGLDALTIFPFPT